MVLVGSFLWQIVAHFVAFGGDILGVVLVDRAENRHLVDHFQGYRNSVFWDAMAA